MIVRVLHMCIIFLKLLGIRFYLITRKQQQERRSERGKGGKGEEEATQRTFEAHINENEIN